MSMNWRVSDVLNHDRGIIRAVSREEAVSIAKAVSAATHGTFQVLRVIAGTNRFAEAAGVWVNGKAELMWQIVNKDSGALLGNYPGDTAEAAVAGMNRDAGYASSAAVREVLGKPSSLSVTLL